MYLIPSLRFPPIYPDDLHISMSGPAISQIPDKKVQLPNNSQLHLDILYISLI